jgi:D-alanyl-D-alanine carboxypeptidase/D-alanyl-D-alanine-endopeptidase (penicillin-binding protein 4)
MRKIALAACAAALLGVTNPVPSGTPWTHAQIAALHRYVDSMLRAPTLRGSLTGIEIVDTVRGTVLYAKDANRDFMPASNFKLLVGSAAIATLGPRFTYVTKVEADASPVSGVIEGNLYLRGGGDALLRASDLDDAAAALAAQGVKEVDGALVTDATRYDDQRYGWGWSWDDLPYYYAPVVSALELEDGVVHVTMTPGEAPGDPVNLRVWPESGAYTIVNHAVTGAAGSKDTTDVARPWNAPATIELQGSYPLGAGVSGDLVPAVPDPPSYAGDVFLRALNAHGISVATGMRAGRTPEKAAVLWTHRSEPLSKLLADFWYPSDNLIGELLLKELDVAQGDEPGTDDGAVRVERRFLRSVGVDPSTVAIADGSGLSHYDHITPDAFVKILEWDWRSPYREIVLNALPVPGVRGTFRHAYEGTAAVGNAFLKDGVISNVRTLSGYVKTSTHGPVTFSFQVNSWMGEDDPKQAGELARLRAAFISHLVKL